ncbi:unnamed protein product [Absidia cylindrospora]
MATPRIYTAVYSGVAVFEMVVKDIAIMRRRVDSHMNATQILKVAGIEKGKRTKILEREILPGEHEKVQGGYGKFQGTWIPLQRSIELAQRYEVYDIVKPMMEFDPATAGNIDEKRHVPTKEQSQSYDRQAQLKKKRDLAQASASGPSTLQQQEKQHHHHHHHHHLQQQQQQQYHHHHQQQQHEPPHQHWGPENNESTHAQKKARLVSTQPPASESTVSDSSAQAKHRAILMSIFLSDDTGGVSDLLKTSGGIDLNMVLDEQGNTALHWAASLARFNTVEQLTKYGADINRQNYSGETPLMRCLAATNSFDRDCFRRLLKCLEGSISVTDHKRRTVLHHTVITSGIHGRDLAALYYMHHLLRLLEKSPSSTTAQSKSPLLDLQDDQGDTALNIAARLDCTRMVELLLEAGADRFVENNLSLTPNDYITNNDNNQASEATNQKKEETDQSLNVPPSTTLYAKRTTASSHRGKEIVATVQKIVDALDEEYGDQLTKREAQLKETEAKLETTNQALETARKDLERRQEQSQLLAEGQQKVRNLKQALDTGWNELGALLQKDNQPLDKTAVLQFDVNQDIDAMFSVDVDGGNDKDIMAKLNARVAAYTLNNDALQTHVNELHAETAEKETQCKRLIAACCNLPVDKIDELVEPLTLAIESDPPDLDLARVIGFMEKIRRQGAFPDGTSPSPTTEPLVHPPYPPPPPPPAAAAAPANTANSAHHASHDASTRNSNNVATTSHIRTSTQPLPP